MGDLGEKGFPSGRERSILDDVLRRDIDGKISVWLVNSAHEVARVAIAINANRQDGPLCNLILFAISHSEFNQMSITLVPSAGETACLWANSRHFDAVPDDPQRAALARQLAATDRKAKKFKKKKLQWALDLAQKVKLRCGIYRFPVRMPKPRLATIKAMAAWDRREFPLGCRARSGRTFRHPGHW